MDSRGGRRPKYWHGMPREEFLSVCTMRYPAAILRAAIICGVVVRQDCIVCGMPAVGHHHDYSAPLDVIWLCQQHHMDEHWRLGNQHDTAFGNIGISSHLAGFLQRGHSPDGGTGR